MEKTLDTAAQAHWQAVHTDYLAAHQHYLHTKLTYPLAPDETALPTALRVARDRLAGAQHALSAFFTQQAVAR
jgi:hypothetical protein